MGPIAYFITFSTHASHLHGDPRGSVDRQHNGPGRPFDRTWSDLARVERTLAPAAVSLSFQQRQIVHESICSVCDFRSWSLIAANVRTQHVHVVLSAPKHTADAVARTLKAWATRRLRERGLWAPDARLWTRGESKRELWTAAAVAHARWYTRERQDDGR